jgi:hypothetical protein
VAFDVLSLVLGLVVGGVAVGMVVEVMGRARTPERQQAKLTGGWRLAELASPTIVARDVVDAEVPRGATVYASGTVAPEVVASCTVRHVPTVRAEFAIDAGETKAILFTSGVRDGSLALVTVERDLVARLANEARALGDRGDSYVERHRIEDLAGRDGVTVETQGLVQDVMPFRERFMIRLSEGEHVIGVLVDKDAGELRDERILVRGLLRRDRTGYPVIEASDIRRIG